MPEAQASLEIDGDEFRFFTEVTITRAIDAIDTLEFTAPFEPDNQEFRARFRPAQFLPVVARVNGEKIFDGTMLDVVPSVTTDEKTVQVSCYARCGVWEDCTAPKDLLPLQFNGFDLEKIAKALAAPFDLTPEFRGSPGATFRKVAMHPGDKVLDFVADLARQRGLVLSSNSSGNPLFWTSPPPPGGSSGSSLGLSGQTRLQGNAQPVVAVTPQTRSREIFSALTGFAKTKSGRRGSSFTESNPFLFGFPRPLLFELDDTEPADVPVAVKAKLGRMFANAASYTVDLATVFNEAGALWTPNEYLLLTAPDAMIYSETQFLVRAVSLQFNPEQTSASLNLVLPGAFSGELPTRLPWDESA